MCTPPKLRGSGGASGDLPGAILGQELRRDQDQRLTGGDILTGRFMRGDFFDFPPSHLILVLSNHLPAVKEGPAFWRRVRLIPFRNVVPEDQRVLDLADQLLADEGPAILGWAVRGAVEVIANGLADPAVVIAATENYRVSEIPSPVLFATNACSVRRSGCTSSTSDGATTGTARTLTPNGSVHEPSPCGSPPSTWSRPPKADTATHLPGDPTQGSR